MADSRTYHNFAGIENARHPVHVEDTVGHTFPWVRINDYELKRDEIEKFEIDCSGLLPVLYIKIRSGNTMFEHRSQETQRKIISVYIRQDLKVYRPIQCDFIATSIDYDDFTVGRGKNGGSEKDGMFHCEIYGELYVPNIRSSSISFHYNGTPDDALRVTATQLKLGFSSSCDTSTGYSNIKCSNIQPWDCYTNPHDFIEYVTSRMWRNEKSYFQSWIDPYYNLTVVNPGEILDAGPEVLRTTWSKFQSIVSTYEKDGPLIGNDQFDLTDAPIPKFLTNWDAFNTSSYYVFSYGMFNQASLVSEVESIQKNVLLNFDNRGLEEDPSSKNAEKITATIYYNKEKLESGDYAVCIGDARSSVTDPSRNVVSKESKVEYQDDGTMTYIPVMASGEENDIDSRTGNVHKMTDLAYIHNSINNNELDKQYVEVTLKGLNLSLVRGDRIPMWIFEKSDSKYFKDAAIDYSFQVKRPFCGEFYISSISYSYEPQKTGVITSWETHLTLTRKEWLTPEPAISKSQLEEINNNIASKDSSVITVLKGTDSSVAVSADTSTNNDSSAETWSDPISSTMWNAWLSLNAVENASDKYDKLIGASTQAQDSATVLSTAAESAVNMINKLNSLG